MTTFVNFTVKDASGKVVRFGTCTSDTFATQAINQGETVVSGLPPEEPPRPAFDDTWQYRRNQQYPSVFDQLDALYHAMDAGTLPKIDGFYDVRKAVKDANPKV